MRIRIRNPVTGILSKESIIRRIMKPCSMSICKGKVVHERLFLSPDVLLFVLFAFRGLKDFFNATLGCQLLYKFERVQYADVLKVDFHTQYQHHVFSQLHLTIQRNA
jgi:hypothetical protein